MSLSTTLDLSTLPPPDVVETLDFEAIYNDCVADFAARWQARRAVKPELPDFNTIVLESDPVAILLETMSYREVLWRSRVNTAARARMLAFARNGDLDHIGANYNVGRLTVVPATADAPAVMESDERYRRRINLAPYAYSSAGSIEAYMFHALTADPYVRDVAIDNPHTNRIEVTILSSLGDGTSPNDQLGLVVDALSPDSVRPLTDDVRVRSAVIITQPVALRIVLPKGPAPEPIRLLAQQRVAEYCENRHRIGMALRGDGIIGAARSVGDLEQVIVDSPVEDIEPGISGAVFVPTVTVTTEILS